MRNTKFSLLYRDADNYKTYESVVLAGLVTTAQLQAISDKLEDGIFLISEQVGLPTPSFLAVGSSGWPKRRTDHVYTTLADFEEALEEGEGLPNPFTMHTYSEPQLKMTVAEFVAKIQAIPAWDVKAEWARMQAAAKAFNPFGGNEGLGLYGPSVIPA